MLLHQRFKRISCESKYDEMRKAIHAPDTGQRMQYYVTAFALLRYCHFIFDHFIEVGMGGLTKYENTFRQKQQHVKNIHWIMAQFRIILMLIKVNLPLGISYLQNPDSKYVDGIDPLWYTRLAHH